MAKFALKADPTFVAAVAFPVAGGDSVDVKITFKHRTKTALEDFIEKRDGRNDADMFMDMCAGWDLDDEFSRANVETLLENRMGVAVAVYRAYIDELVKHRAKN
jgi:hypothetical protein